MILKIINVVVYFAFFASIILVTGSTSIYFDKTYVTPAPLAFHIGFVNHLFLLGSIIYQFSFSGELYMDRISWRFSLLVVLHAININLLLTRHYILALICTLFINTAVNDIYYLVNSYFPRSWDRFFIHRPFSLHRGWTTVLVIVTALEAVGVNAQTDHANVWRKVFAFLALFLLDRTAIAATLEMDFVGCYAIRAGLSAIAYNQTSNFFIRLLAFVFAAKESSNYRDYRDYSPQYRPDSDEE